MDMAVEFYILPNTEQSKPGVLFTVDIWSAHITYYFAYGYSYAFNVAN